MRNTSLTCVLEFKSHLSVQMLSTFNHNCLYKGCQVLITTDCTKVVIGLKFEKAFQYLCGKLVDINYRFIELATL